MYGYNEQVMEDSISKACCTKGERKYIGIGGNGRRNETTRKPKT
jgi:hypothetical protein